MEPKTMIIIGVVLVGAIAVYFLFIKKKTFKCPKGKTMAHYDGNSAYDVYCYDSGYSGDGCVIPPDSNLPGVFKGKTIGKNADVGPLCGV